MQTATQQSTIKTIPWRHDPQLDSGTKKFLKVLNAGGPPVESLSPLDAREVLVTLQASATADVSGIEVTEKTIEHSGYTIDLHIVRPEGVTEKLPVFIFIHGGGWLLGDFPTHKRLVRDLVVTSGYASVFVNYTRTPDAEYPRAVNECYAATQWVAQHGDEINVDGTNMAIVGNSVGGNLSTVTALIAKEAGEPLIKLQVLLWPIVDHDFETGSYQQFGQERFLTTPLMKWLYDMYTTSEEERNERYNSPLRASIEQLKGMPPTLIQTAENCVLRDEGEAYGRKLDEAGVPVTTIRYTGVIHDFGLLNGMAELPATRSMIRHAAAELKHYLSFVLLICTFFLQLLLPTHVKAQAPLSYMDDPRLSPEVKQFLKELNSNGRPLETLSPAAARQALADAQASVKVDLSGIAVTQKTITTGGFTIPLYIVKPEKHTGVLPVMVFIHGGGWILGDFDTHKRMVRDLVVLTGAAAVFIEYTRTPDAAYPRAINEIYAATKWVADHGAEIGVDGKRLAIVGNSVGGNMTAVTALKAKEMGGPAIKFLVMFWPIVDADFETQSYREFGQDRFLSTSTMKWMYDMYIKDPGKRKEIYASPLQASLDQLRGLPPVLIQVAENDVLRDEGEAFGRKLSDAGVRTATVRYNGVIHDFGLLNGLAGIPQTHALFLHAASELKKFLK